MITQELFQIGARHVGQLDLGLLRGRGGHAAFDDVLLAGTGRLDHLVMDAAAFVDEAIAEMDPGVVHDLRLLVGEQLLVEPPCAGMKPSLMAGS